MDEERKEYLKQYRKENLKRIPLDVRTDMYELIKVAAEIDDASVSRYIKGLIEDDLEKKKGAIERWKYRNVIDTTGERDTVSAPVKQKVERVIVKDQDRGFVAVLLSEEEAEKFREGQKRPTPD